MKFFDSCVYEVTLVDVADDIKSDERFEQHLKRIHELRTRKRCKLLKRRS